MVINWIVVVLILFFAILRINKYAALFILVLYFFLRGDYGNDYYSYLGFYNEIRLLEFHQLDYYSDISLIEKGWVYLNWISSFFGVPFNGFIVFWNIVYLYLLNKLISSITKNNHEYNLVILLMVLDPDFILTHFSLLRQAIPLLIFYLAFLNLRKLNKLKIIVISVITISIHSSAAFPAVALLISYLVYKSNINLKKINITYIILIVISILSLVYKYLDFILAFIFLNFTRYQFYLESLNSKEMSYGLSFFWVYSISFFYYIIRKHSSNYDKIFLTYSIYMIILPLGLYIGAITRISFYFQFSILLIILEIYRFLRTRSPSLAVMFLMLGCIIPLFYKSYSWFHQLTWIDEYLNYL